jgi:hypothetical protein
LDDYIFWIRRCRDIKIKVSFTKRADENEKKEQPFY